VDHGNRDAYGNSYDPNVLQHNGGYRDEFDVVCPPHITERRMVARIDFNIISVLGILYLSAFWIGIAIVTIQGKEALMPIQWPDKYC
jgi:hypothetical protein